MKSHVVDEMVGRGLSAADANRQFDAVFDAVKTTLGAKGTVRVPNFGVFTIRERKEKKGVNPRTGEPITIPAKDVIKFKETRAGK